MIYLAYNLSNIPSGRVKLFTRYLDTFNVLIRENLFLSISQHTTHLLITNAISDYNSGFKLSQQ